MRRKGDEGMRRKGFWVRGYGLANETGEMRSLLSLAFRIWSLELGTWNLELGAWSLELGTWNLELGA